MSELTKLEAGKTYVFKDELACILWSDIDENDYIRSEFYDDGFAIDEVYEDDGYICDNCVIGMDELRYFKLKEDETMQQPKPIRPEDEVTITAKYGDLAKVLMLLGRANGKWGLDLFSTLKGLFGVKGSVGDLTKKALPTIRYTEVERELLAELFPQPTPVESPTQRKARDMREQAELLLAKARELEGGV